MTNARRPEPLGGLPPELASLDRELLAFDARERESFGPELEAELHAGRGVGSTRRGRMRGMRTALAAALGGLLLTGVLAPPARASFARLGGELLDRLLPEPAPVPQVPDGVLAMPLPELPAEPMTRLVSGDGPAAPEAGPVVPAPGPVETGGAPSSWQGPTTTFPRLVDLEADRALIQRYYPRDLQEQGIGGSVRVVLWVDVTGTVDEAELKGSSGVDALDRAALEAATHLRFQPATRYGIPVGTWVEFDLVFAPGVPSPGDGTP